MVRRRRRSSTKAKVTRIHGKPYACKPVGGKKGSKAAYKKCLLSTIKRTKISTPKSARKAFNMAARHCKVLLTGKPVAGKKRRRSPKTKRKYTRRTGFPTRLGGSWNRNIPSRARKWMEDNP